MQLTKINRVNEISVFQLRAARAGLKLSLEKLSELTGITKKTLSNMESGDMFFPPENTSILTLLKVNNVYKYYDVEFFENNVVKLHSILDNIQVIPPKKNNQ